MSATLLHDFDRFVVEYLFKFILISEMPISIGGGNNLFGVDKPIVRLNNKPYIPGSTLKGVLRSHAERFVRSIYGDSEENVCNILSKTELERKKSKDSQGDNNYQPCIICEIFGGPTIASRIKIHNAEVVDNGRMLTSTIRRVSIDRITNAQARGRLFDIEYLLPKIEMKWTLSIENIELLTDIDKLDERSKKIINVIEYLIKSILTQGIEVGGKRSIGYGLLKVKEESD
ncbi:MAG: RAMP superfamily CRISPR-associated protein, partial [Candidatus Nitrosocaldus sp.]